MQLKEILYDDTAQKPAAVCLVSAEPLVTSLCAGADLVDYLVKYYG